MKWDYMGERNCEDVLHVKMKNGCIHVLLDGANKQQHATIST